MSKLTYNVNLQQEFERRVTNKIVTYVDNMKWIDQMSVEYRQKSTTLNEVHIAITAQVLEIAKDLIPEEPRMIKWKYKI